MRNNNIRWRRVLATGAASALLMTAGVGMFGSFTGLIASWILSPSKKDREQDSELLKLREQVAAIQQHLTDTLPAREVSSGEPELTRLQAAWPDLPPHVKTRILGELEGAAKKAA